MAVYTVLEKLEIQTFLENFNCGSLTEFKGITAGVENTNYFIYTDRNTYVLTIFEKRFDKNDLPYFLSLMNHMNTKGVICPKVMKNKSGTELQTIAGKPAILISFLSGKPIDDNITPDICGKIGEELGKIHNSTVDFELKRKNILSLDGWKKIYDSIKDKMSDEYNEMVNTELKFQDENKITDLPSGAVHTDLFVDNIFFENGEISGIIDFYFSCNDTYVYDLAITITAWCFDDFDSIDTNRLRMILDGYKKNRKLNENEKRSLSIALRGAALRFLLTRQYDEINTKEGSNVVVKDPSEYAKKLKFYQNNNIKRYL